MSNHRSRRWRCVLALAILSSFVGCDQVTKGLATKTLQYQAPSSYMYDTVRLEYALNSGGFLSLGASLPKMHRQWMFVGCNILLLACVAGFLIIRCQGPLANFVAFTCILAGGLGNLIDRVTNNGEVIDFIILGIGPLRTGVFNIADVAVMGGVVMLLAVSLGASRSGPGTESSNCAVSSDAP